MMSDSKSLADTKAHRQAKYCKTKRKKAKDGKAKTKNKDVCFAMLNALGVQGCDFKGLKVGPKGTCIDFAVFGTCPNYKICNYHHNDVDLNSNTTDIVVKNLEKGLAALSTS